MPAILELARVDSLEGNRSLQSLVELIYVREGNKLMSTSLTTLESALSTTQGMLDSLKELQTLHNKVGIENPGIRARVIYVLFTNIL